MSFDIVSTGFQPFVSLAMGSSANSAAFQPGDAFNMSFQAVWSGVAGSPINGVLTVEVSNVPNPGSGDWNTKTGASLTITSASGTDEIALIGVLAERWLRLKWTHTNVSAGTLNVYAIGR